MKHSELTHDKIQAEIANLMAETSKLNAETSNLNKDTMLMIVKVYTAALATVLAAGYVIVKFTSMFMITT